MTGGYRSISSKDNPTARYVRELGESTEVRWRDRKFLLEGPKFVHDALIRGSDLSTLLVSEEQWARSFDGLVQTAMDANVDVVRVCGPGSKRIGDAKNGQGVVAIARLRPLESFLGTPTRWNWIFLNGVQDPGNVGAVIRTAAAVGGFGLICDRNTADPLSAKAIRSSVGLITEVPVVRVNDALGYLLSLKRDGYKVVSLASDGRMLFNAVDVDIPAVLVLGSEGSGLDPQLTPVFDESLAIPMNPVAQSLNVAVAGSLVMYEFARLNWKLNL